MPEAARRIVRRIYGNLARLLGGKAAGGVMTLAYMAIAARALGTKDYGVLILVHTYVMTVGGLIEFPGWHAIVRYGAQTLAAGDRPRLTRLLAFASLVEGGCGVLAVLVAATLAPLLGPHLGWSQPALDFALPYSLAVLASVRATPAGYLQLTGRFDLLGLHNLVAPTVRLAGAVVAMTTHSGLRGFLVAWLAAALAEGAAMWALGLIAARGTLSRRHLAPGLGRTSAENPGLWRFMWGANADVTLSELSSRAVPLAVGWLLGPAAAGLYAVAQRATTVIAQPALILGQAAFAEIAHLVAGGERGPTVRGVLARAVGFAVLAALPVCAVVALFGGQMASLLAGRAFAGAAPVMLWLALARTVWLAAPPASAALTALGRPGLSVLANMVGGVGLLLILPPLLDGLGLVGGGVYAVIQAAVSVGLLVFCVTQETAGTSHPGSGVRA